MLTWNVMEISNLKGSNNVKIAMMYHYSPKVEICLKYNEFPGFSGARQAFNHSYLETEADRYPSTR